MVNDNVSRVVQNLVKCKRNLQAWHRRKFKDIKEQIASLKHRIDAIQDGPCSHTSKVEEGVLLNKLNKLWEQDEMYWHQRSRLNYLRFGDGHTRFFHITATQRRQRNLILRLKNEREEWVTSPRGISDIISQHFHSIFTDVHPYTCSDSALSGVSNKISADSNANLCKAVSDLEITSAVFQMGALKAPGPDGFPGLFYQKYWELVKEEVSNMVRDFFNGSSNIDSLNQTNIVLVPKIPHPEVIG